MNFHRLLIYCIVVLLAFSVFASFTDEIIICPICGNPFNTSNAPTDTVTFDKDEYTVLSVSRFNVKGYKYRNKKVCFEQMSVRLNNGVYDILLTNKDSRNTLSEVKIAKNAEKGIEEKLIVLAENHKYATFYGYIDFFQKDRFAITAIR